MTDKGITKKLSRNIWFQCFLQPSAFAYLDFAFVNFDSIHNEVFSSFIFVPQAPVFAIRDFIWCYSLVVSFSEAKMIPLCTHFCRGSCQILSFNFDRYLFCIYVFYYQILLILSFISDDLTSFVFLDNCCGERLPRVNCGIKHSANFSIFPYQCPSDN